MKRLTLLALGVTAFITCAPYEKAQASSQKSDKEIVQGVTNIMTQMSDEQRSQILQQAEIIKKQLMAMSQKERNELTKTVRSIGSSIDVENINVKTLEKIQPSSLEETMENFQSYQERY